MDVSIIFVNYKTKDLTINAVNSVIEKTEGIEYEIFVVDNNSQDGSIEAIEENFPDINTIKSPINAGFGAANNMAIRQAQGKYIFCLNTDTLLINNAIKIMFDFMEKEENQNVGACGCLLQNAEQEFCHSGGRLPSIYYVLWKFGLCYILPNQFIKFKRGYSLCFNESCEVGDIIGADIFLRKSILDEIGLFDEKIFMYREETDLCKRIQDGKKKVKLLNTPQIIHLEGGSTKNNLTKNKIFRTSDFYYFKKHHPFQYPLIKLLYLTLYFIGGYIGKCNHHKEMFTFVLRGCKE